MEGNAAETYDAAEALSNFAYNVGIRSTAACRSAHSYIEKAEYWAVVWGAIVMIASGTLLWANNLMLKLLPKIWLDIATSVHFYEALLATLAIVVWHFYSIIFDPDVYPMDTAWYTGVSVKKHPLSRAATRSASSPNGPLSPHGPQPKKKRSRPQNSRTYDHDFGTSSPMARPPVAARPPCK